jgi:hypothetical protein
MNTKLPVKFKWLEPYLELSKSYLPEGKRISRVSAWSIENKRVGQGMHACIMTDDWITYRIYIHTHRHPRDSKVLANSKIDILGYLAHELAHTLDMDHTPKHKILEMELCAAFMKQLKREGYISEEEELSAT